MKMSINNDNILCYDLKNISKKLANIWRFLLNF